MNTLALRAAKLLLAAGLVSSMVSPAQAHITVLAPNGGEAFNPGDVVSIDWQIAISHNLQSWDLWYSTTGKNGPWIPIAVNEPPGSPLINSIHSYDWVVPNLPTAKCRVRVRMNNTGTNYLDISNTNFTINAVCGTVSSYCTAGTSASGCQATMSASGTPSASAPTGFFVTAANLEGNKDGLLFFGTNGQQANAWGNGTSFQCVTPPVMRGGLLTGSGTPGACDGQFMQDLNARWTAKPGQNPGSGAVVQVQTWYRDPQNTSNQTTSLSDAIEFCVAP